MIADLSNKLVHSILVLMLSHFLGVIALGSYSVAHTFFSFGLMFSYWGFGNLLTREIARDRTSSSKYLINFSAIRIIFALLAIVVINLLVVNLDYIEQTKTAVSIISFGILANTIINLIFALFIAFEEIKYLSIVSLTVSIIRLVIFYFVLRFGGNVVTIAIFYTCTEFLSLIISLAFTKHLLKEIQFELDIHFCLQQIVKAFPFFWIAVLVIMDSRVEILIISLFLDEGAVGYYTAMNTIIGGLALFSEGIRNAVFPLFARYQINDPNQLKKMVLILVKYIMLVTLPITIGFYFLSEEITSLLFGPGFQVSADILKVTVWTFFVYTLTVVAIRLLMVHDREKDVVFSLFISGMLTIFLNILFTPRVGLLGVAVVRLFTSYILFLLCVVFLSRQGYLFFKIEFLLPITMANISIFFSVNLLTQLNIIVRLFLSIILYFGIILITKVVNAKEIKLWRDVLLNIFGVSSADKIEI
jgi:O-antigen/teichoic acid export membrane protein